MHKSKAKVVSGFLVFGGWKGELSIDGDIVRIDAVDHSQSLVIDIREIKRASYNSNNGLWSLRFKNGRRARFQSAGGLLSADRTEAGRVSNELVRDLLQRHGARFFGV
jgi:hypothetical protein